MRPAHGARIVLRFVAAGELLRYGVELYTQAREWRGSADVDLVTGAVSFGEFSEGEPPLPLLQSARSLLRAVWRSKPESGWPRRITRWRALSPEPP